MRKSILLLLVFVFLLTTLTGCFDAQEVSEWSYVYSIGLEKGQTDKLRLTVQLQSMKSSSGEGSDPGKPQGEGDIETVSVDCPTFHSGLDLINTYVSRQVNYMHTKYLVFSENLAKEGVDPYVNALIRGRQIRRNIYFIVSRGSARELLQNNTMAISSSLTKKEQNMIVEGSRTGFYSHSTYGDIINDMKNYYGQGTALLAAVNDESKFIEGEGTGETPFKSLGDYNAGEVARKGGSKAEILGTAVFDGGKLVGELNGDETRALLMVRNEFYRGFFVAQDPMDSKKLITMDIRRQKSPKVTANLEQENPVIDVEIFLEGDILAMQSTINYESKELKPLIENEYKQLIKEQIDKTIK
ncbi:MAG TPA: Ger(x)C family spore germination protein, partial [Clostridia bacterium]